MGEVTTLCNLWNLGLRTGKIYGFTDHDDVIKYAGETYHPQCSAEAGLAENRIGFSVDNGEVKTRLILPDLSTQSIHDGALDNAVLSQFRYDWQSGEADLLFKGRVGDVRVSGQSLEIEWLGQSSLLDRSIGRVFSRQCDASFGDVRCGLNAADYERDTLCARSFEACRDRFNNSVNFRGFPYLLGDDALQAGVRESDRRDGSSRYR